MTDPESPERGCRPPKNLQPAGKRWFHDPESIQVLLNGVVRASDPFCLYLPTARGVFRISHWRADFSCDLWHPKTRTWTLCADDPGVILLNSDSRLEKKFRVNAFLSAIDPATRAAASRFHWMQFTCLRLIRFSGDYVHVAIEKPVIFWIVANAVGIGRVSYMEAARLVRCSRREIVGALYGDQVASGSKWLERTQIGEGTKGEFDLLETLLLSPEIKKHLGHFKAIELNKLQGAHRCPDILACAFLKKAMLDGKTDATFINYVTGIYKDTLGMAQALGKDGYLRRLNQSSTYRALRLRHDRLVQELNSGANLCQGLIDTFGDAFPSPPAEGTDAILPILTVQKLYGEGESMQHCVLLYAERVFSRQSYFYYILEPERCTLEVVKGDDGLWKIGEIKRFQNEEPSLETRMMVQEWLVKWSTG